MSKKTYVTVYKSIAGWKAVLLCRNEEGCWEPWQTGLGCYPTEKEAADEGMEWAMSEGVEFRP